MRRLMAVLAVFSVFFLAGAGKPPTPGSNAYGWAWDHNPVVCDLTNNPRWDVAGAVAKFSTQGLHLVLADARGCLNADITVTQGDANAFCSTTDIIIGCTNTVVSNGHPVSSAIVMNQDYADWVYASTLVGGTLHEMGHAVGFTHAPLPNKDSVMGVPIPGNCNPCARTTLSSFDKGGIRAVYR